MLRFGFEGGFLMAAGLGLVRAALSDYRKLRADLGLARYTEAEMLSLLEGLGLTARRLERNPGHNQSRMAFMAVKLARAVGVQFPPAFGVGNDGPTAPRQSSNTCARGSSRPAPRPW